MRNRARQFATAAAALAASVAPVPVAAEPPGPFEIFHGPDGVAGFVYPAATGAPRSPAVVIVHDALGIDARSHRYVAQLTEAGLIVLEVELRANPPDGVPEPLPGEGEAAGFVARAAAALADDPRVDPARVGGLGFGIGARAVVLAPSRGDGRDAFAARVLLYPGCGSLGDLVEAPERVAVTVLSPVLLLHGEADPANSPAECGDLSAALGTTAPVRRISYRGAAYAWDLPQSSGGEYSRQPGPNSQGTIPARSWPELAELTATRAAAFLANTLSAAPADAGPRRTAT